MTATQHLPVFFNRSSRSKRFRIVRRLEQFEPALEDLCRAIVCVAVDSSICIGKINIIRRS